MQYYTRERLENVRVENGMLVIEGRIESMDNPDYKPGSSHWREQRKTAHYTSGSINTNGKVDFLYGRIEMRAQLPQGRGVWPAFWALGTNRSEKGWPLCGEIDIMEYVGKEPHTIHANIHHADPNITDRVQHRWVPTGKIEINEPYNNFHIYAIEWDEEKIDFFVDDTLYATFNIEDAGPGAENPFRKPHYLLVNLALGGHWGGEIDESFLPQKYIVDYVRAYRSR